MSAELFFPSCMVIDSFGLPFFFRMKIFPESEGEKSFSSGYQRLFLGSGSGNSSSCSKPE